MRQLIVFYCLLMNSEHVMAVAIATFRLSAVSVLLKLGISSFSLT